MLSQRPTSPRLLAIQNHRHHRPDPSQRVLLLGPVNAHDDVGHCLAILILQWVNHARMGEDCCDRHIQSLRDLVCAATAQLNIGARMKQPPTQLRRFNINPPGKLRLTPVVLFDLSDQPLAKRPVLVGSDGPTPF